MRRLLKRYSHYGDCDSVLCNFYDSQYHVGEVPISDGEYDFGINTVSEIISSSYIDIYDDFRGNSSDVYEFESMSMNRPY